MTNIRRLKYCLFLLLFLFLLLGLWSEENEIKNSEDMQSADNKNVNDDTEDLSELVKSESKKGSDEPPCIKRNTNLMDKILCHEDDRRIRRLLKMSKLKAHKLQLREFFQIVMAPIQNACQRMRSVGGKWYYNFYDGRKFVCMDDFESGKCIVYSFGIADDVTFETTMMRYGCRVYAYDHTVPDYTQIRAHKDRGFYIYKKGIDAKKSFNMTTFKDELTRHDHLNSSVTYLKADIEGSERELLLLWAKQGLLDRVQQIGIEFHGVSQQNLKIHVDILTELFKLGFKVISFDPNYVMGTNEQRFMQYFEIVFRKVQTNCQFDDVS